MSLQRLNNLPATQSNLRGKDLLLAVKAAILEEPKRLRMGAWIEPVPTFMIRTAPKCGTVACIAGWACIIATNFRSKVVEEVTELIKNDWDPDLALDRVVHKLQWGTQANAVDLLQITAQQADELFFAGYWSEPFATQFRHEADKPGVDPDERSQKLAEITAARIDAFIAEVYPNA